MARTVCSLPALAAAWLLLFAAAPVFAQTTPAPAKPITLKRVEFRGVSPEAEQRLRQGLPIHNGDLITPQLLTDTLDVIHAVDSHLGFVNASRSGDGVILWIGPLPLPTATFQPSSASGPQITPGAGRAGSGVTNPVPFKRQEPQYTEAARIMRWGGTVLLTLVVDEKGVPKNLRILKPLGLGLDEKAVQAVSKWRFHPATKDGKPVAVAAQIEITFRLL